MLNEPVTRAVKYALPAPRSGTVRTSVRQGWVEPPIRDDGVRVSRSREGSLGYGLVRSPIQQTGGTVDVRSGDGVAVTVTFPGADRAR